MSYWERNLQELTDNATSLLAQWTSEDVHAFAAFMCSHSPQLVKGYHNQRPTVIPRPRISPDALPAAPAKAVTRHA